ncbi:MAG: hypothetical protein ABIL58_17980 [Pseudomonadota bacterium]
MPSPTADIRTDRPLSVHPRDRMIWQPDMFLAGLAPGQSGADNGYGIGDCLLIDAQRGIYAVADASDRCPQASRALLEHFHAALPRGGGPPSPREMDAAVAAAFADQAYTARSTFCCVALRSEKGRSVARITSGGDSFAAVISTTDARVVHQSASDMTFAGRSKNVPTGRDVVLDDAHWCILLATDGWHDLSPPAATDVDTIVRLAAAVFTGRAPRLKRILGGDDLAFIIVSPGATPLPPDATPAVIMGGTSAAETAAARRRRSHFPASPGWLPPQAWPDCLKDLDAAGIRVLSPGAITTAMENLA